MRCKNRGLSPPRMAVHERLTWPALYLYPLGLGVICSSLHGDLEQPVLEIGADHAPVYAFWQVHGPSEVPVIALSGVVTHILRFAPALGVLPHSGHLAHVVHEPPKWVACPAHLPSFCVPVSWTDTTGGWPKPPAQAVSRELSRSPKAF